MMKVEIPSRRVVLRGAMAVGFSLLAPAALFGCNSKQSEKSTSPAPTSPAATSAEPAAPESTGKATQSSVQYQAQPKEDKKCSGCMHFVTESNTCNVVDGQISPDGWCSLWVMKA